jgi:hypothetical protein
MRRPLLLGTAVLTLAVSLSAALAPAADAPGKNIALGAKYTLFPQPNYGLCTDPDDRVQLTDGKSTRGYFWTQRGTVGWSGVPYASITVDLGRVEPIAGGAPTTAAGAAQVRWPGQIQILTSDDGRRFRDQGDLVALDVKRNGPLPEKYAIRRLLTGPLQARGRYVMFLMLPLPGSSYTFVDEVEVFRGPDDLLRAEPRGEPIDNVRDFVNRGRRQRAVRLRYNRDAEALARLIRQAPLDGAQRQRLSQRLAALRQELDSVAAPTDAAFKAILPIGAVHA